MVAIDGWFGFFVSAEYKNWWTPVVGEIKIDKKKNSGKDDKAQQAKEAEIAKV